MKPYEINDTFPKLCTWKYQEQSVKEVLIKDSGYIKDLILLNENFALSEAAFGEAMAITKGFADKRDAETLADPAKAKKAPYDLDFNDEKIMEQNKAKLTLVSSTSIVEGGAHDVVLKDKNVTQMK